jgi:hypothetical protein
MKAGSPTGLRKILPLANSLSPWMIDVFQEKPLKLYIEFNRPESIQIPAPEY